MTNSDEDNSYWGQFFDKLEAKIKELKKQHPDWDKVRMGVELHKWIEDQSTP